MASFVSDSPPEQRLPLERMLSAVAPSWSLEDAERSEEGSDSVFFLTVEAPAGRREVVLKAFTSDVVPTTVASSEPLILEQLCAETDIPVPEVIGTVHDHPDLPTPYFVAERLPGENGAGRFHDLSTAARERIFAAAGTHLAELHELESFDRFGRVGLAGDELAVVGDDIDPQDQWRDWLLADVEETLDGMSGGRFDDLVPGIRKYLREAIPGVDGPGAAALVHWDYRLGNLLLDRESGETEGVLDWAGLLAGDPLYNLVAVEDHNINWQTRDPDLRDRLRGRLYGAYREYHGGEPLVEATERKRLYHLCERLNAMACLPDWYGDEARRDRRADEHRAFVEEYLG